MDMEINKVLKSVPELRAIVRAISDNGGIDFSSYSENKKEIPFIFIYNSNEFTGNPILLVQDAHSHFM